MKKRCPKCKCTMVGTPDDPGRWSYTFRCKCGRKYQLVYADQQACEGSGRNLFCELLS